MPIMDKNNMQAQCDMACKRIRIRQTKLNGEALSLGKDVAKKYKCGDVELAQIAVENVINMKKTVAALEILYIYIQTLCTRIESLNYEKAIPANMRKYIASIIYCNGRVDVKEIKIICQMLVKRYSKELDSLKGDVDPRISSRLTPSIPNPSDVEEALQDILRKENVEYKSSSPLNPIIGSINGGFMPGGGTPMISQSTDVFGPNGSTPAGFPGFDAPSAPSVFGNVNISAGPTTPSSVFPSTNFVSAPSVFGPVNTPTHTAGFSPVDMPPAPSFSGDSSSLSGNIPPMNMPPSSGNIPGNMQPPPMFPSVVDLTYGGSDNRQASSPPPDTFVPKGEYGMRSNNDDLMARLNNLK